MHRLRPTPLARHLPLGLALLISGAAAAAAPPDGSESRPLPTFNRLRVEGALQVEVVHGGSPLAQLSGPRERFALVHTRVEGDTLVLSVEPGLHWGRLPQVRVTAPQLLAAQVRGSGDLLLSGRQAVSLTLAVSGSGDLVARQLNVSQLDVAVAGSGDVRLSGQCQDAQVSVAGSGDIDAGQLTCQRVQARIAGTGDVTVQATQRLDGSVAGSGDLRHVGQPAVLRVRTAGIGQVQSVAPARSP